MRREDLSILNFFCLNFEEENPEKIEADSKN